jgi:hypothetical protein
MATPVPEADYHGISFRDVQEAAAFLAALSRFLNTPDGSGDLHAVEIWGQSADDAITLFLNDETFNATAGAFGQPPSAETYSGVSMPDDGVLLIGGGSISAWGVEEAEAFLRAQLLNNAP